MPSCPSTVKPRWMMWMISRLCGMATARAASSARATSISSIDLAGNPGHAAAVDGGDMRAGQADQRAGDLHA